MTPSLLNPLRRVVISTFEDLALLLPEAESAHAPSPTAPAPLAHAVRVVFTGPRTGFVDVRASDGVGAATARNMLADDYPAPALCADALAEVANVICGNLVPVLAAPDDIYRLDAPVAVPVAPAPAADACVQLAIEGGTVDVRLVLAPPDGRHPA